MAKVSKPKRVNWRDLYERTRDSAEKREEKA